MYSWMILKINIYSAIYTLHGVHMYVYIMVHPVRRGKSYTIACIATLTLCMLLPQLVQC